MHGQSCMGVTTGYHGGLEASAVAEMLEVRGTRLLRIYNKRRWIDGSVGWCWLDGVQGYKANMANS